MDDKLFKILKKVYCKDRTVKDKDGTVRWVDTGDRFDSTSQKTIYSLNPLSDDEKTYLYSSGYPVNEIVGYSHDDCIKAYKELLKHPGLTMDNLISAYICGFSGFPRGRQPILTFLFAKAVPEHDFAEVAGYAHCDICAIRKQVWIQRGYEVFRKYWGYSWTEFWGDYIVELQEFSELPPCIPTEEDIRIFNELITMIRNAPSGETPGKLEQRIKKSKIIPKYEKYRFRGQLLVLAELGVMPNPFIKPLYDGFTSFNECCEISRKLPGNMRSDMILPLGGWRGDYAIDEERLRLLFGRFIK